MKYICTQPIEDRQHPWIVSPARRRVSVGFPSRPTARVAMTLLCKSRKRRRRRAIGAALTLRKSSPSSSSSSPSPREALPTSKTFEGRPCATRTRGVIIWLVNFYCARRASFLRGSLRRCHVRPCQPLLRATLISFFFFYLSRSLSRLSSFSSSCCYSLSFSLSVAQIYIQRQGPTRHTRERRGARVSGALSLFPLSKANLLYTVFRGKSS